MRTDATISTIDRVSGLKQLLALEQTPENKQQQKHTICFPAHGEALLLISPDTETFVTSKIVVDYDVETNPRYGDEGKWL